MESGTGAGVALAERRCSTLSACSREISPTPATDLERVWKSSPVNSVSMPSKETLSWTPPVGKGRGRLRRDLALLPSIESRSDESDCEAFHLRPALTLSGACTTHSPGRGMVAARSDCPTIPMIFFSFCVACSYSKNLRFA